MRPVTPARAAWAAVVTGDGADGNERPLRERLVNCRDRARRMRTVRVLVTADHVLLIAPAGELAVLSPIQVRQLRAALKDAVAEHALQRGGDADRAP